LARRSLKPQLNQIRTWVRQGRTDAWIAHQLEVSVSDIRSFKRDNGLAPDNGDASGETSPGPGGEEALDLRAEDDALVAAALEAEGDEESVEPVAEDSGGDEGGEGSQGRRRRGRRGGRRRGRGRRRDLEGTFDHGEEGYGLWLDPAVQDDPVYAEHWAGHRPVAITIEAERIIITRAGEGADSGDEDA